jgi:superkiller protein 3
MDFLVFVWCAQIDLSFMMKTAPKIIVLQILITLGVGSASSQDLGSSSGLFGKETKTSRAKSKPTAAARKKTQSRKAAGIRADTEVRTAKVSPEKSEMVSQPAPSAKANTQSPANPLTKTGDAKLAVTAENTKTDVSIPKNIVIKVGEPVSPSKEQLIESAIEKGNTARDERDYFAAENAYRYAQTLAPGDSRPVYGLGNLFSDQQRWEEAEEAYRKAITLEANEPEPHIALSFVLSQPILGANLSERYDEAATEAKRAIELSSKNAIAWDQLGLARELTGQIGDETQKAYRKAIELDPNFALAYAHLGRLLRRNGLVSESEAAYKDAIRLAQDVPTMILVADVMQSQQRFSESSKLLERALRDDPRNPTALFLYARALITRGSFADAEQVLKRSVAISPKSFVAYSLLGSLYSRQNDWNAAEEILNAAGKIASRNEKKSLAQQFESIGDGLMKLGKKKDAARVYKQSLEFDKERPKVAQKLAKAEKG